MFGGTSLLGGLGGNNAPSLFTGMDAAAYVKFKRFLRGQD
jgi:hypothetical protein